jgi:hypothetical protein
MEGFDKELWIVEVRNNKKVWTKRDNINKMTYEIPLINEPIDIKETDTIINTTSQIVQMPTIDAIPQVITYSVQDTAETRNDLNILNSENNNNPKIKISKTIKPTDYTLFITYRIHQLKQLSNDNKKNYDDAREEWKEYKKNPSKLQSIMIEANNFSKIK